MSPSLLSSLPSAFRKLPSQSASQSSIEAENEPNLPWEELGSASEHLLPQLRKMYWDGVKRELTHILLTLREWQLPKYSSILLEDEEDDFIHGYDTFLDQVSYDSRIFAQRYGAIKKEAEKKWRRGQEQLDTWYINALQSRARDFYADQRSEAMKASIRKDLAERRKDTVLERRARVLLQSAGFLDIDKLIEHRPPLENLPFWKRPPTPQLTLKLFEGHWVPIFAPLRCIACQDVIRGSFFHRVGELSSSGVCESCFRKSKASWTNTVKTYKHCILREAITGEISRQICRCSSVPRADPDGKSRPLFPMASHGEHRAQCGLLDLVDSVAQAKYEGWLLPMEKRLNLSEEKRYSEEKTREASARMEKERRKERAQGKKEASKAARAASRGKTGLHSATNSSLVQSTERTPTIESTAAVEEDEANEDIPAFMKPFTDRYPFGNIHMALRVGPLLIENGVKHTKGGALITSRDPPNLQVLRDSEYNLEYSLALGGQAERRLLWCQKRTGRVTKRYKAAMKQVVGGAFCEFLNTDLEREIISDLISESQRDFEDPGLPTDKLASLMEGALERLFVKVKLLLVSRVDKLLNILVSRLLDPSTELHWDRRTNNCQNFCDALISTDLLGSLIAPSTPDAEPLYLISFVCRPGSYLKEEIHSKFDVPNGQIEEYLLKFRFGRHDEADVVDTLQEYWYDWGAFGGHIYKYQDIFPWDCTEAYGRYPVKCNDCNLAKHVWSFPFDSWSIIYLHLARDRSFYAPVNAAEPAPLSDLEWMRNRLTVLLAQDMLLSAAVAMARSPAFRKATKWLQDQPDPRLDRLKLGGIHRAQPFSHHFERGKYQHYFIASWAHLHLADEIAAYELLRDGRVRKNDVSSSSGTGDGTDGGGEYFDGGWVDFGVAGGGVDGVQDADAGLNDVGHCNDGWDGNFDAPGDAGNAQGVDGAGDANDWGGHDGGHDGGHGGGYDGGYGGGGDGCGGGGCGGE
ncbi:MAG: hypothetical protein M1813_005963 [Trichoglossum hirsutum]|nr:MAG: hypothetical protein M1813_005963 [Trichoglossum hirsutum]